MLIEFSFENFGCFRDRACLSFVAAPRDDSLPHNFVEHDTEAGPLRLVRQVALFGANASGKSTVIQAMASLQQLLAWSPRSGVGAFGVTPFLFDSTAASRPRSFSTKFLRGGVQYEYDVECDTDAIVLERLAKDTGRRRKLLFERRLSEMHFGASFGLKRSDSGFLRRTGKRVPVLAVAAELEVWHACEVRGFLLETIKPPVLCGHRRHQGLAAYTAGLIRDDEAIRTRVLKLLRDADFGISAIEVDDAHGTAGRPVVEFSHARGGVEAKLPLAMESDGTQRIFELAGPMLKTASTNGVLFADELDMSLHPRLVRRLVETFGLPGGQSQLIFTAHDTSLMDLNLLRRDQIWFTSRGNDGRSELIAFRDFGRRKDEAIAKAYLEGRYGAVPIVAPLELAGRDE